MPKIKNMITGDNVNNILVDIKRCHIDRKDLALGIGITYNTLSQYFFNNRMPKEIYRRARIFIENCQHAHR